MREYIVDPAQVPWKRSQTEGITFNCQVLLDGLDGGPEAIRFKFDPCPSVYAHMHLTSQYQLLLGGTMDFPRGGMKLRPVGLHYADHNRPYGPFSVADGHDVLVLHPRQGGLISMSNIEARKQIFLGGRQLTENENGLEWLTIPGREGFRVKIFIPRMVGPEALMIEFPPETPVALSAPAYGRYEVVIRGSVLVEGRLLGPPGFRYVRGDQPAEPLQTGPDGATMILLSFDKDALEGGLTGEGIAVEAAEMMTRAI